MGGGPVVFDRVKGAYAFDVDGNQYVDYVGTWGPAICGHANDEVNEALPNLKSFILPGGGTCSALMHQARTVCRRAERRIVSLHAVDEQRSEIVQYLNRLSDWFFVMGRHVTMAGGHEEVLWQPGKRGAD